ncbi:hypothetical protein FRAAL0910 [Frankia alni ACN14a]|uniref:Uncharacterized protein n=1 Tax=Frankia alni (strain DSM 45986 / CECT 9034 / ACN14a) TaxID=326424 RepID=Q0RS89_FRAAA|nr:hypothetical protein FRAAL0910 [Frankia alni ACN14a]
MPDWPRRPARTRRRRPGLVPALSRATLHDRPTRDGAGGPVRSGDAETPRHRWARHRRGEAPPLAGADYAYFRRLADFLTDTEILTRAASDAPPVQARSGGPARVPRPPRRRQDRAVSADASHRLPQRRPDRETLCAVRERAPGRNRTYGLPLRRRSLYPLSYWGGRGIESTPWAILRPPAGMPTAG